MALIGRLPQASGGVLRVSPDSTDRMLFHLIRDRGLVMIRSSTVGAISRMILLAIAFSALASWSSAKDPPEKLSENPFDTSVSPKGDTDSGIGSKQDKKEPPGTATTVESPRKDSEPQYEFLQRAEAAEQPPVVIRFGYWGTHTAGNVVKVGEYQDLNPSPFFDVDGLRSDGEKTLDFTVTGTDNESTKANLSYYRPGFEANVEYDRFLRQLGHDPMDQFTDVNATPKPAQYNVVREDLNVGRDYAIRVQELKANFKGQLTEYMKVRLDVWGMSKEGERQARGVTICFPDNHVPVRYPGVQCHVLSQTQRIDWVTMEVKPAIQWDLGPLVVEYSRPMRSFSQNDQIVTRLYTGPGIGSFGSAANLPYDVVPENFTQIDQVKIGADLSANDKVYAFLFNGNTHKESDAMPVGTPEREGNRRFCGADVRWTDTMFENVTTTTYAKFVKEDNQPVTFKIPGEEDTPGTHFDILSHQPIDYQRSQFGSQALWRPFGRGFGLGGLAIDAGYEYSILHRTNATFPLESTVTGTRIAFTEENTTSHMMFFSPSVRWSSSFDTYVRYKWFNFRSPLYGVTEGLPTTNSSLPEHENFVEIGGTWMPSDDFMLNAWFEVDVRRNSGRANFNEQSYPFGINGWYAMSSKWTLSGGYAYYTNWVNQTINFGTVGDGGVADLGNVITQWNYGGRAQVFNVGSTYACTARLKLVGSAEYVKGIDSATMASGPAFLSDVPAFSRQDVDTTRLSTGINYQWKPRIGTYMRYVLFDYHDKTRSFNSGTSNTFLGGLSAIF